jgi:predicted nucleotidyltransferase
MLARRQPAELMGTRTYVATAEDSIVSKLEWAKQSDSTRQLRDVAGIVATRADALDLDYIERWVSALGLEAEWARARAG